MLASRDLSSLGAEQPGLAITSARESVRTDSEFVAAAVERWRDRLDASLARAIAVAVERQSGDHDDVDDLAAGRREVTP